MKKLAAAIKASRLMILCILLLSGAMLWVFRLFHVTGNEVLYGTLLGTGCSLLNLILLQLTLSAAGEISSENNDATQLVKRSVTARLLITCICFYIGFTMPLFNKIAVVLPFVFPRLSALLLKNAAPVWQFARTRFFKEAEASPKSDG